MKSQDWTPATGSGDGLTAEEHAVFELSVPSPGDDHVGGHWRTATASSFSWETALDFARRHRVLPAVAYNLQKDADLERALPDSCRHQLRTSRSFSLVRRTQYADQIAPLLKTLTEQSILVLLMKGAALIAHTYPPKSRLLNDIDLLIPKSAYDRASTALEDAGFQKQIKFRNEAEQLDRYHQVHFVKQSNGFPLLVDLHWEVYPLERQFHFDTWSLFETAVPVDFAHLSLRAMSPEDVFVHLATQLINDSFTTNLLRLADLATLIRCGLVWDRVLARAEKAQALVAVDLAITAVQMLGVTVAESVRRPFRARNRLVRVAASAAITPEWPLKRGRGLQLYSRELVRVILARHSLAAAPFRYYRKRRARHGVVRSMLSSLKYSVYLLVAMLRVLVPILPHPVSPGNAQRQPDVGSTR